MNLLSKDLSLSPWWWEEGGSLCPGGMGTCESHFPKGPLNSCLFGGLLEYYISETATLTMLSSPATLPLVLLRSTFHLSLKKKKKTF